MNLSKKELNNEEIYLEKTLNIINEVIKEKEIQLNETKNSIIKNKRHLWQNKNEYNSVETYSTMNEEDLSTDIVNETDKKVTKLYRSLYSPYFGKVTFKSNNVSEDVYIGLTGIQKDTKNYVYDWRAPIANLYYNYGIGLSSYTSPNGVIAGENTNKRQFKIASSKLVEVYDTDITIEDELLQQALFSHNNDKMKNIVSTIQKEQNEIIRYTKKKDLIIEGIAGSGKTSVALHRVAYLLYNDQKLTNKNVLIISPSTVFTNYISDVLPDLGEEEVPTITIDKFIKRYIPVKNIDYKFHKDDREKYKNEYLLKINKDLDDYFNRLVFKSKLGLKKKFITSSELNSIFKKENKLSSFADRITYLVDKICDLYDISYEKNATKLADTIKNMLSIPNNPIDLYKEVTGEEVSSYISCICALYINFEVNGYLNSAHIKEVVIDEVQDYPYLLLFILKKTFSSAEFTLLGDAHQSINPYFKYNTLACLSDIFKNSKYMELKKTYRSSHEIIEYANKILGLNNIESIRKPTNTPVIERKGTFKDVKLVMDELANKYDRIALIVKEELINESLEYLSDKNTSLITDNSLKPKLIVPAYMSKGLEFDAVIIYTTKEVNFSKDEKNLFYVCATRAMHELVIISE